VAVSTASPGSPSSPSAEAVEDGGAAPARDAGDARLWGAGVALLALIATFGATIFTSIPGIAIGDDTNTAKVVGTLVSSLLQNLVFVGVPILIVGLSVGGLRRSDIGWRVPPRPLRVLGMVAVAFVAYIVLSALLGAALGVGDEQDDLPGKLGADSSVLAGIAIGLAVTVLAPIGEETLLRGIVYPGLRNSVARFAPAPVAIGAAALIDGLIFGALHLGGSKAIFLPILALFGVVLCLLYQFSGSLYASILLHATNNTIAMKVALDWSVLGAVALWVSALSILTLLMLGARAYERGRDARRDAGGVDGAGGAGRPGSRAGVATEG
jgi:membrane protease YdiL (CAAX protease family)